MANRRGKGGSSNRFPLLGLQNHCGWWLQPWKKKMIASWQESNDKPRQCIEKQRHYSAGKGPYSQGYSLPSDHIWLWEPDHKNRTPMNWCLQTVVLEKTPKSSLDSKEIQPVNLKLKKPWILGRTEAEAPIFWSSDSRADSLEKPQFWERFRAKGKEGVRGWDGWMTSPMQWIWTWENFGRWWETGKPGVLQSMGLQRVGHDWVTEQQQYPCWNPSSAIYYSIDFGR